jgi:hypothetical protein
MKPEHTITPKPRRRPWLFQLFLLILAAAIWTLVARLVDGLTHNFGLALLCGGCSALCALCGVVLCRASSGVKS